MQRRIISALVLVVIIAGLLVGVLNGCGGGGNKGGGSNPSSLRVKAVDYSGHQIGLSNYNCSDFLFGLLAANSDVTNPAFECYTRLPLDTSNNMETKTVTVQLPASPEWGEGLYTPVVIKDENGSGGYDDGEPMYRWYPKSINDGFRYLEFNAKAGWSVAIALSRPDHDLKSGDVSIAVYNNGLFD